MKSSDHIDYVRELALRCRNREALSYIDGAETSGLSTDEKAYLQVIRAVCQFELHRVEDMTETLRKLSETKECSGVALYSQARILYFRKRYREAHQAFQAILTQSENRHYRFRALLGIANIHYSEGNIGKIPELVEEMNNLLPHCHKDDQISLLILRANYERSMGNLVVARETYREALKTSVNDGWTFFVMRALYGLAQCAKQESCKEELQAMLKILQCFINESECLYFAHLVNEQFIDDSFNISLPMSFDASDLKVSISGRVIALHDKPLLFKFLQILCTESQFVSKEQIARRLWADESYHPSIHDPRIFDIAKRARGLIEAYEEQPVALLSGRLGYKLAVRTLAN